MNDKKVACILLIMIIASIAYGTQMMTKRANAMRQDAENARTDADAASSACQTSNIGLVRIQSDTQELRQFLDSWTPVINRLQTSQDAEEALLSVVRNSGILVLSQKFEARDNRGGGNLLIPRSLQGTITVQDDYAKTMNWLGELECKLPLIRVTSCRLKQGETGRQINLELHFEVPLVDLNANLDKK